MVLDGSFGFAFPWSIVGWTGLVLSRLVACCPYGRDGHRNGLVGDCRNGQHSSDSGTASLKRGIGRDNARVQGLFEWTFEKRADGVVDRLRCPSIGNELVSESDNVRLLNLVNLQVSALAKSF